MANSGGGTQKLPRVWVLIPVAAFIFYVAPEPIAIAVAAFTVLASFVGLGMLLLQCQMTASAKMTPVYSSARNLSATPPHCPPNTSSHPKPEELARREDCLRVETQAGQDLDKAIEHLRKIANATRTS